MKATQFLEALAHSKYYEGVIQGLFELAISDSLFPCHSIKGGKYDCAVAVVILKAKTDNNIKRDLILKNIYGVFSLK